MPAVAFEFPQLLILLLLVPLVWRHGRRRRGRAVVWLRVGIAVCAVLAAARPHLGMTGSDTDIILLADRSASCGEAAGRMLDELLPLVRRAERGGDRTAVIAFGSGAVLERGFTGADPGTPPPDDFETASDLAAALRLAASIRAPGRRTAVLCLGDGLYTGEDPLEQAVTASADMPFWFRHTAPPSGIDTAAGAIIVPESADPRSAWIVRYSIHASAPCETEYTLSRNGLQLAAGRVGLRRGANHFFVRDTSDDEQLLEYRLSVRTEGDAVPGNDTSRAVLQLRTAPRALLVNHGGMEGLLAGILRAASIPVTVIGPEDFPGDAARLAPYRLVVLENVRLSDFPGRGVRSLAAAAESGLTALLVTGGPNSFGMGGYHRSALDPLLPVEMELRNDIRRSGMALAVALDRSGSMAVPAGGGAVKMDLANQGAAEAIRLLSPRDQVAVLAVDTAAHTIVPLSLADETGPLIRTTLGIKSMGGGIFTLTAMRAAAAELRKSPLLNRNILIFADAADAEEQEGCFEFARELLGEGIRTTVVALGDESDVHAQFLIDLARHGDGEALFAGEAGGLPALFTQEVMRISQRGFIEEPVTPVLLPALHLLGLDSPGAPPTLDGYNVSHLREGSAAYMMMDDEFGAPLLAARFSGRTAAGAMLFEAEGEFSGGFPRWQHTPALVTALARRLAGGVQPAGIKAYSSLERGRAEAVFEFSGETAALVRGRDAGVRWLGPDGLRLEAELEWTGPREARAEAALSVPGHYVAAADFGEFGVASSPPVTLSYSAEYDLRAAADGRALLSALAERSGGGEGINIAEVRESARAAQPGGRDIASLLAAGAVLLFLIELSGRRLRWL